MTMRGFCVKNTSFFVAHPLKKGGADVNFMRIL